MKKFLSRRFLMLLFAVVLLFGLAAAATLSPSQNYTARISKLPPSNGKFYRAGEIDTKVTITFSYSPFRDLRLTGRSSGNRSLVGTAGVAETMHFEDGEGNPLSPQRFNSRTTGWIKTGFCTYDFTYEFPRPQLPKSVKRLTFHATVANGNGWTLPVSVPL